MVVRKYLESSIARKLVFAIVLISSLITLVTTVLQLYLDYRHDVRQIGGFLEQIETSHLPSLANSLWELNDHQVAIELKGILGLPGMEYIEITNGGTKEIILGERTSKYTIEKDYSLIFKLPNRDVDLGVLHVANSLDLVYRNLLQRAVTVLISNGVKTFIVAGFILLLVHHLVTKRLFSIVSIIEQFDVLRAQDEKSSDIERVYWNPHRQDEFEEVVKALSVMQDKLVSTFQELEAEKRRYRGLFESSPVPLWEEDFTEVLRQLKDIQKQGIENFKNYFYSQPAQVQNLAEKVKILDVNQAALELHGAQSKGELLGNLEKVFTEKSMVAFTEEVIALASGLREFETEGEVQTLDGVPKFISLKLVLDDSDETRPTVLLATTDITKRREKERERERLINAIEHVADSVIITDASAHITYVNPAFEKNSGYSRDEALGRNPRFLQSGDHDGSFYQIMWNALTKGQVWQGQLRNKRKDGSLFYEAASISPIVDKDGVIVSFVAVKKDITEERETKNKLLRAAKMESIGNLAGGVAHDFNNILASILGYSEILMDEVEKGSPMYEDLQEIYTAGIRAKELVNQILLFARQSDEEFRPIKVEPIIKEVMRFLKSTLPSSIKIRKEGSSDAAIMGIATQLHQVFMNLCTNASQAMVDSRGEIVIHLEDASLGVSNNEDLTAGEYLLIEVSDTGGGIAPGDLEFIFEPYYSTKGPGEGTGLGLSVVQGIIKSHGGNISVESVQGRGTSFTMYLPRSRKTEVRQIVEANGLPHGSERILFVDDDAVIAEMGSRMLSRMGYSVTYKTDSVEALELFAEKPYSFDLMISDVTMPNMTGDELAVEVMKVRPGFPVILCTGYSSKISMESAMDIGIDALVYKPIVKADLAKTVRLVLDKGRE